MQLSSPPTLVPLPFADSGAKNAIPESASPTPGLASLTTGFPPVTMTPLAAGGIPPAGQDMNGILNLITQTIRWANAGGGFKFDSAFATDANVGGYPQGTVLLRGDGAGYWLNLADNNTTDPEGGSPANWAPLDGYGTTAITGLTNANVTLTPAQFGLSIIALSGALTGNVQIVFPALKSQWLILNNTTGNFTITCKTAAGSGAIIAQGGAASIYGDGTNINLPALAVGTATQPAHAVPLAQAQAMVDTYLGFESYSAATTLGPSDVGQLIGVAAVPITLPLLSTFQPTARRGDGFTLVNTSTSGNPTTVNVGGGSDHINIGGIAVTSFLIPTGQGVKITRISATTWLANGVAVGANIPLVIAPAVAANQAVQLGQVSGVVGQTRNLVSNVAVAAATKVVTADEIIVETALGGLRFCLSSLNLTGNLATQMDTGTAPASGYVAEYVIYNPNAAISGTNPRLLYTNAATLQGNVYGGANMPAGYTASALISVWPTNASKLFSIGYQQDRDFAIIAALVLNTNTPTAINGLSIANVVPINAKAIKGTLLVSASATSAIILAIYETSGGVGMQEATGGTNGAGGLSSAFSNLKLSGAQTTYYMGSSSAGTPSFGISISGYTI